MNVVIKMILILFMISIVSCGKDAKDENDIDVFDEDIESDENNDVSDEDIVECKDRKYEEWDLEFDDYSVEKIKKMSDGGYLFIGAWHEIQEPWHLSFSMIGKLDKDFIMTWGRVFEQEGYERDIYDFRVNENGTIYAAGTANTRESFWLNSFSSDGELLWEKDWKYEGFEKSGTNKIQSLEVGKDGVYVAGFTAGYNAEGSPTYTQLYFAKTDFDGDLLWEKVWGPRGSLITSVVKDSDENFYLTGYTAGSLDGNENAGKIGDCDGFFQFGPVGESSCTDPFLIKIDSEGDVLWNKQFGTDAISVEASGKLLLKNTEIYVLSGIQHKDNFGSLNITKFNTAGNMKFSKNYLDNGGDNTEYGYELYLDKNGMLIIAGRSKEKDIPMEGFALAVDKETGEKAGEKRLYGSSEKIGFAAIFENESGLNVTGFEETGSYTVSGSTYQTYKYGMKNLGYFYLSESDTTITTGDEFERETVQCGSKEDDEIVFSYIDSDGSLFVAGNTWGSIEGSKKKGEKDIFVAKYKADKTLEWIKNYGSDNWDNLIGGEVDSEGNIVLSGSTWGDFEGNERLGMSDIFVMKIDETGNILWAETAGSDDIDRVNGLWVDAAGNIFITGNTHGSIDDNVFSLGFGGNMFAGKWDNSGNKIIINQWGPRIEGLTVTGDNVGNIYLSGRTDVAYVEQSVFDTGVDDIILFKLDEDLNEQWAVVWGSEEPDSPTDIVVDSSGDIYVVGYTFGAIDGNLHLGATCPGEFCPDAYITKFDSTGERSWTRQFGTEYGDRAYAAVIDEEDNIFISGTAGHNRLCEINPDIFLIKSDTSGNLDEMKIWGTNGEEKVNSINYSNGNLIISGFTTGGLDDNENTGQRDAFVTEILFSEE